jgi:hypothetical protein
VEWYVSEARARGLPEEEAAPLDLRGEAPIPMSAPTDGEPDFHPLPNELGRTSALKEDVVFQSVETATGAVERGQVSVGFDRDGTSEDTSIRLADESGRVAVVEVRPLADAVRVFDEVL